MTVKHWGEDPVGDWTIVVSDQGSEMEEGAFLGWNMVLWGSTVDASTVKKYEVPMIDTVLPPIPQSTPSPAHVHVEPSGTVNEGHSRPTDVLPSDHGTAEGENSKQAFPGSKGSTKSKPSTSASASSTPSASATPQDDWISNATTAVTTAVGDRKWVYAVVAALLFAAIAGIAYWWRHRLTARRSAEYRMISDDLLMTGVGGIRDGGVSNPSQDRPAGSMGGLEFHDEFLDDDAPGTAATPSLMYRDEPDQPRVPPTTAMRTTFDPPASAELHS